MRFAVGSSREHPLDAGAMCVRPNPVARRVAIRDDPLGSKGTGQAGEQSPARSLSRRPAMLPHALTRYLQPLALAAGFGLAGVFVFGELGLGRTVPLVAGRVLGAAFGLEIA